MQELTKFIPVQQSLERADPPLLNISALASLDKLNCRPKPQFDAKPFLVVVFNHKFMDVILECVRAALEAVLDAAIAEISTVRSNRTRSKGNTCEP